MMDFPFSLEMMVFPFLLLLGLSDEKWLGKHSFENSVQQLNSIDKEYNYENPAPCKFNVQLNNYI